MSEGPRDQNDDRWQGLSQAAQRQPGSRGGHQRPQHHRPQDGPGEGTGDGGDRGRGSRGGHGGSHGRGGGGRGRHADPSRQPDDRRGEEWHGGGGRGAPREGDRRDQHDRPRGNRPNHQGGDQEAPPYREEEGSWDRGDRPRGGARPRPQREWRDDRPPHDARDRRYPQPEGGDEGRPQYEERPPQHRDQRRQYDDAPRDRPRDRPYEEHRGDRNRDDYQEEAHGGGYDRRDQREDSRRQEYGGRGRGRGRGQQWSRDADYDRAQYSRDVFQHESAEQPSPSEVPAPQRSAPPVRERPSREPVHVGPEVEALFKSHHKQTGIDFDVYDTIEVDIVPKTIPPVQSFDELNIHPLLQANFDRSGYKKPTPVQRYGIPATLAGKDLMACAQTGSGKTVAFLTPILQHVLEHGVSLTRGRVAFPIAVIMAPTRELALQIFDEARKCCFKTDVATVVIYGGAGYSEQIANLDYACDIIVATPGRLKDLFDKGRISFERVKFLVLDEADRMLELGFEEQVEELVCGRHSDMPPVQDRQTMMYSATFPRPIQNLARRYMKPASFLLTVGRVGSTTKNITQRVLKVEDSEKQAMVLRLLYVQSQSDLVLIFMQTKHEADELCDFLLKHDIPCSAIHGDRQQWQREAALSAFKRGEIPILVATDVASRGLDIPNVAHVIQYDLPNTLEDYVHRIGRTGRAGNKGCATCFFNRKNEALRHELIRYLKDHDQDVPDWMEATQMASHVALTADFNRRGGGRRGHGGDRDHAPAHRSSAPAPKAEGEEELADDWETLAGISDGRNDRRGGGRGGRGGRGAGGGDGRPQKPKVVVNEHDGGF